MDVIFHETQEGPRPVHSSKRPKLALKDDTSHVHVGNPIVQQKHTFPMTAELEVGPRGGSYDIPSLGVEMLFPQDALNGDHTISVTSLEKLDNFPLNGNEYTICSPRLRIEPSKIRYRSPVHLRINHNIPLDKTGSTKPNLVLFHREHGEADWRLIPIQGVAEPSKNTKLQGLEKCTTKQAVLTSSSVMIAMTSNCDQCLCLVPDELGVNWHLWKMALLGFATFKPDTKHLKIKVYLVHNMANRIHTVRKLEAYHGNHTCLETTTHVDKHESLGIDIQVSVDGHSYLHDNKSISKVYIGSELDQAHGLAPHVEFDVKVATPVAGTGVVEMKLTHSPVGGPNCSITTSTGSFNLSECRCRKEEQRIATIHVKRHSLSEKWSAVISTLNRTLTDGEMQTIRAHHEHSTTAHNHQVEEHRQILLNWLVADGEISILIGKLNDMGITRSDLIEKLEKLR